MAAHDTLGTVCDRLVGGTMFHLEHADLCRWLGVEWLAREHEGGHDHDTACLKKMRALCIRHLGTFVPEGRQERGHLLDAYRQQHSWEAKLDVREAALRDAMTDWVDWESGTATLLASASSRLADMGELLLSDAVRKVAKDTSRELARARQLMMEMDAAGWDICRIIDME